MTIEHEVNIGGIDFLIKTSLSIHIEGAFVWYIPEKHNLDIGECEKFYTSHDLALTAAIEELKKEMAAQL